MKTDCLEEEVGEITPKKTANSELSILELSTSIVSKSLSTPNKPAYA